MLRAHVHVGMPAWAAYGETGWSAVRVLKVRRKNVEVERVKPRTGEVVTRNAKARIDRLVKRDPKLKGKDRPEKPPSEFFIKPPEAPQKTEAAIMEATLSPTDLAILKQAAPKPPPRLPEPPGRPVIRLKDSAPIRRPAEVPRSLPRSLGRSPEEIERARKAADRAIQMGIERGWLTPFTTDDW